MDLHDSFNVQRVFRALAVEWGCPVWMVRQIIQQTIDRSWEKAMSDSKAKALWDKYFPSGKPTPDQYILLLGHAHESGETVPFLFNE